MSLRCPVLKLKTLVPLIQSKILACQQIIIRAEQDGLS
uniref:Uncharacterized protein n=1 Tax=Arundo donax TaxID=35708 RepID=A0A0A8YVR1_ARUDO